MAVSLSLLMGFTLPFTLPAELKGHFHPNVADIQAPNFNKIYEKISILWKPSTGQGTQAQNLRFQVRTGTADVREQRNKYNFPEGSHQSCGIKKSSFFSLIVQVASDKILYFV